MEDRCLESSLAVSTKEKSRDVLCYYSDWMFNLCFEFLQESNSSLERQDCNIHDPKQEQEQPSPVSVLERIHLEDETVIPGNVKICNLGKSP